jgi:hypothetical protein
MTDHVHDYRISFTYCEDRVDILRIEAEDGRRIFPFGCSCGHARFLSADEALLEGLATTGHVRLEPVTPER